MAPPIPGLRPPPQAPRRTGTDILLGVLAVIALAALTIGVPIALVTVFGLPIPHKMPSSSVLTHQLDFMAIMKVLAVVVWLAWLQLVWCVIVEIKAAVGNAGNAARVPLAGATQSAAHRMVLSALLLFSATAALAPAFTHSGAPAPVHTISAQQLPGMSITGTPQQAHLPPPPVHTQVAPNQHKIYVVHPPAGRYHESLWEIAHNHLGDGRRYKEIFELNKDHIQPDGSKLTIASLIRPGWVLNMPSDAHGPGIEIVQQHHAEHQQHSQNTDESTGTGVVTNVGMPGSAGAGGAGGSAQSGAHQQETQKWPYELSSASLLAAGVLVALGRRRREQLWRRAFGKRLAAPEGDAAVAEQALRLGADDPAVQLLDRGLRQLTKALADQGRIPPTVFAAHLGKDNLDLWVAPPDPNPPRPWQAADQGQVWRLPVPAVARMDPPDAPAPYPGLISIGTNDTGRVLVDLEVAHGVVAVRGPQRMVQATLAALAVELVTNRWSDKMKVTLVGFGRELSLISPERVVAIPSLDEALPELERQAAEAEQALSAAGYDSVLTGRSAGDPDTWAPHYLIMGVPPTQAQADRLLTLARTRRRTAAGYVVAGDVRGATWTWDVTEEGRLVASALGFDLQAQMLPPEQYAAMVSLFRDATAVGGVALANPAIGAAPAAHLAPDARFPVEVCLLGQATISAPGTLEAQRLALATELVVYLAAHGDGVHMNVLTGAVWPRGVTDDVRDSALARVKAWLGTDESGAPNLQTDSSGRLRLGPGVRVDWQVFRALISQAGQVAAAPERAGAAQAEADLLDRALQLVRGQALDGHDPSRYAWLTTDTFSYEVTALVADAAHRLSALRFSSGDAQGAMEAARAGLRLAFDDEQLWRDLILGAHATGQEHVLRAVVGEVSARTALDEVMPRMAPETEALIDELLPSWRTSAA